MVRLRSPWHLGYFLLPLNNSNQYYFGMYHVTTFYHFFPVTDTAALQSEIYAKGEELGITGLVLVAHEGLNATVAGSEASIIEFKKYLQGLQSDIMFKDSQSDEQPFKRWLVKIRTEIVAIGDPQLHPDDVNDDTHLTPDEWNEVLDNEEVVVLDARNTYETAIGKFKDAVDPELGAFDEFPEYVKQCDIPKDKKVLMYCTGGIRCEKACLEMKRQGYQHVYQLKGGILQYLKEHPDKHYDGECFVFDHRAAVGQDLKPSAKYRLCPHCGDPGGKWLDCKFCNDTAVICKKCAQTESCHTCSKNCRHHFELGHKSKVATK